MGDHRRDLRSALGLAVVLFVVLVANGRPIGAGDTRPTERVAASLVEEHDFDLDEHPEVAEPFAREERGHRVSIYPVLSAVFAAPIFAVAGTVFALDETGTALAGKIAASSFSALAGAVLLLGLRRRGFSRGLAVFVAAVFVLGTPLWSTSQALWTHPLATLMLSLAVYMAVRANASREDAVWAGRAGLPLALAVAARHADVVLAAALAIGIVVRWPRRVPALLGWAAPGVAFVLGYQWVYFGAPWRHGFSGRLSDFDAPWGEGLLGLLVSPAKGVLVFTPVMLVALVGLVRAFRGGERWIAATLGAGLLGHWVLTARWAEWHGGACFGPRLMTGVMAFAFVFLADGLRLLPRIGATLAGLSVGIQALGAFGYDYRWEDLYQRPPAPGHAELWSVRNSPLAVMLRERVVILATPVVEEGRARIRESRFVAFGPRGSKIAFGPEGVVVEGERALLSDVALRRGARVEAGRLLLHRHWDGLCTRVAPGGRRGDFDLVLEGEGSGPLYVGEKTFRTGRRWTTYLVEGHFLLRHPYHDPDSGGPDLYVTVGRGSGQVALTRLELVPGT